jgi:hypothetical protein
MEEMKKAAYRGRFWEERFNNERSKDWSVKVES